MAAPLQVQAGDGVGGGLTAGINIRALLETHVAEEPLESLFHGCVKQVLVPERSPRLELQQTLQSYFSAATQENLQGYVEQYVRFVAIQTNHQRVVRLLDLLTTLVANGTIKAKLVCETILKCIDPVKETTWCEALRALRRIVSGVDYKGCRDLIRVILDKFDRQPRVVSEQQLPALLKGKELLAYILDRNAALLPAYFAHDEIKRHFPPDKNRSAHWILQEEIARLESSMRTTADLVSGIVHPYLRPVLGVSNISVSAWRLDPTKHCCALKGLLPYREALLKPQEDLLLHVMAQPNSRDAVHSVLGMNRQQLQPSTMVEDALVRLGMVAMEITEGASEEEERVFEVWSHFASQLVFCYFLQLVSITAVLTSLRSKLSHSSHRKGRGWLMWALLHFVTSTIQQKQQGGVSVQKELVPILNLSALLYSDKDPLPLPDTTRARCVQESSMASVWIVYASKAESDGVELPRPTPHVLSEHIKWIQHQGKNPPSVCGDYTVPLLLNIYSNNAEISGQLLNILLEALVSSSSDSTPLPLPLPALNTLAMHAKIRLMEKVKLHLVKVAESAKQPQGVETPPISHALLETYSRLLVWLGTRNFQTQLIPVVFKSQAWGLLHVLLEVICHRVHLQLQFSYRFQLLQQLHTVAGVSIIPNQLFITAESAALRLIQGLNSPEFINQLVKQFSADPKPLLSTESEELNRVFVLVLAKTLHISNTDTVTWLEPFMKVVLSSAPHFWPESTLAFFPPALRQLCSTPSMADSKGTLLKKVEDEVKKFKSKTSEGDMVQMFTEAESAAVCLCVLWRLLMDGGMVNPAFIKQGYYLSRVAQRSQPKKLAAHMRKMVDYIIFTLPPDPTSQLKTVIMHLRELVWKYKLFPLERLVLYMVLHGYEGRDAQNCLLLLQYLLASSQELHQRASVLVKEVPADYWSQSEWNQKHATYLSQFPESFQPEAPGMGSPGKTPTMPMFFGNLCLRFLPVMDLVLQRLLEVPDMAARSLEQLLELYGPLYKFHDHPIAFLFITLHYYERTLAERPGWKKKLVATIAGAKQAVRPLSWYFTAEFCEYLSSPEGATWEPQPSYYSTLVDKLVRGLQPFNSSIPACDWRFSEFSGSLLCSLHCCMLELLALPLPGKLAARNLVEALYSKADTCSEEELLSWVNALGLVFASLPESFHSALSDEVLQILLNPQLILISLHSLPGNSRPGCLLSLMHAYWHHTNLGTLASLPHWLQTVVRPMVKHEEGLLYVCHLMGPLLQRLHIEKPRVLMDIVAQVYLLVQSVDKHLEGHLQHSDVVCDFLYHIKYMHIGDIAKDDIDRVVSSLHPPLQLRLRFLVPSSMDQQSLPAQSPSEPMQV